MARREQEAAQIQRVRTAGGWDVTLRSAEAAISWCSIIDRTLRVGHARLHVGGIGGVGTRSDARRRGHARRVLEAAVDLMRSEAYDISFLHGIQDFYGKFGYATCMPEYELWMDTRDAERARGAARTRRLRRADLIRVIELYTRDNALRVGSAVREPRGWRGFKLGTWWTVPARVNVVLDAAEQVIGYVVVDDTEEACRVSEVGGRGEIVYATVLAFLARRAVRLRRERIGLYLPEDHPFAVYARRYGLRSNTLFPRAEKGMGRIIDLTRCMRHLCPELTLRWPAACRDQVIVLQTPIGEGRLRWGKDGVVWESGRFAQPVQLKQEVLMQLVFGYVHPSDLANWGGVELSAAQQQLLGALFPRQLAQLWWADRF